MVASVADIERETASLRPLESQLTSDDLEDFFEDVDQIGTQANRLISRAGQSRPQNHEPAKRAQFQARVLDFGCERDRELFFSIQAADESRRSEPGG